MVEKGLEMLTLAADRATEEPIGHSLLEAIDTNGDVSERNAAAVCLRLYMFLVG
jgi:hypothetical protein